MKRSFSLFIALFVLASASNAAPVQSVASKIDALIETEMARWQIPGLAIAVIDNGDVYAKGFGVRTLGVDDPVDENTVFAMASNSKAFTCAALCMLVDDGVIGWDDLVIEHFPEFQLNDPLRAGQLMIRDLVTHRSGVETADRMWIDSTFSFDELLKRMSRFESISPIRSTYRYHNLMFNVAGKAMENASGKSWHDLIHERIFNPLGMTRSGTRVRELPGDGNFVSPHEHITASDSIAPLPYWIEREHIGPAGSVQSCAADMAKWMALLVNQGEHGGDQLISEEQAEAMQSPHTLRSTARYNELGRNVNFLAYAMGHNVYEYKGVKFVQHSGTLNWQRSFVCMIPERKFGVAVMSNLVTPLPYALAYAIADMAIDNDGAPDWIGGYWNEHQTGRETAKAAYQKRIENRKSTAKPSLEPQAYAGEYIHPLYGTIVVSLHNGAVHNGAVHNGAMSYRINNADWLQGTLTHWHYDTFHMAPEFSKDEENLMAFTLNENAEIDRVVLDGDDYIRKR